MYRSQQALRRLNKIKTLHILTNLVAVTAGIFILSFQFNLALYTFGNIERHYAQLENIIFIKLQAIANIFLLFLRHEGQGTEASWKIMCMLIAARSFPVSMFYFAALYNFYQKQNLFVTVCCPGSFKRTDFLSEKIGINCSLPFQTVLKHLFKSLAVCLSLSVF